MNLTVISLLVAGLFLLALSVYCWVQLKRSKHGVLLAVIGTLAIMGGGFSLLEAMLNAF
ncbi:MAG TPA: hypothetical protein VG965_02455 [Patescibacteria group bacterium]|nr:hypothetical protein [Patescibacteria group bacterium]